MKRANPLNINTKTYWNGVYGTKDKRAGYAAQGTDNGICQGIVAMPTKRFITALTFVNNGDKVIDFGCGVGVFTKLVKETYPDCEVWGTDISDQAIEDNKKENPDINYHHAYIGDQKFLPKEYFDVVFSGETIEHLDEPETLLQEAYSALKQGGKLVITTPLMDSIRSDEHTWFYEKEDIEKLYKENGFTDIKFVDLPDMEWSLVIFAVGIKK